MKRLLSNTKVSAWIIATLIVLNLITIGFLVMHINAISNRPAGIPKHGKPHAGFNEFIINKLNFDDQQSQMFDLVREEHIVERQLLTKQIHLLKRQVFEMTFEQSPDSVALDSLLGELSLATLEFEKMNISHLFEIQKICNPEQRETLKHLVKRMYVKENYGGKYRGGKDSTCN